jgi:cytosine/adenosine deaminase-related metal-dependent hydrolase
VVFLELLGLSPQRACAAWKNAESWMPLHPAIPTCRPGVSPHAPYSAHRVLFTVASMRWQSRRLPVAVHLAETKQECQLLSDQSGPFVAFLQELGVWDPRGLAIDPADVAWLCRKAHNLLLIHANFLPETTQLTPGTTIVYCPRTHAAFGHPPHPFRDFLQRGVRVALGTDSLASNPDLDLLAEARFIHRQYPDFPGDALLRMATLSGAEGLGWADETGSLTPDKSADLAVVPLPDEEGEPHRLLFGSSQRAARTMFRGQWVWP